MKKRITVAVSLALIVFASAFYSHYQHQERVRATLAYGQLALLPPAVTNLEVDTTGGLFSRTFWLTFQASNTEIANWLKHSPTLTKIPATQLTRADYQSLSAPTWFTPEVIRQGEVFRLAVAKEAMYGTVWVDKKTNTVYIKVSHS
jgi:hypothetical protein